MKIASTLFLGFGALVASFTSPAGPGFTTSWEGGDSYIAGGAYEVTISVDVDATEPSDVPSWSLNSSAFKLNGKALGKRANNKLTLDPGTHLTATFDLGPALVEAGVGEAFELSFAEGEARKIEIFKAAPAGLTFMDPSSVPDGDLANYRVLMHTNQGDMLMEMYPHLAPNHVRNFLDLNYTGYYDNVIFHRVIPTFMIQGGDKSGTGAGPGRRQLNAEFSTEKHVRGILSMARTPDVNSASAQFFVMHAAYPSLDGQYSIFGKLISGYDTLDKIVNTPAPGSRPSVDQVILSSTVLYVPSAK
jgi:cyclophilin family peptidyl-prolyl cis-trans isomerase